MLDIQLCELNKWDKSHKEEQEVTRVHIVNAAASK